MTVKQRLKELIDTLQMKQYQFAKSVGVSGATVSDWLNTPNVNPSIDSLVRISEVHGISLQWLLTGVGPMLLNRVPARAKASAFIQIPVVADIAAGLGIEAYDVEPSEQLILHQSQLSLPGPYIAFKVVGDSMAPFIYTGDLAIVTQAWHDLDLQDRVLAFRTIDGLTLKRFYLDSKRKYALLIPYNPTYPVLKYTETDPDYTVLGLLLLVLRRF